MYRKALLAAALAAAIAPPFAHRASADNTAAPSSADTAVAIDNYAFKAPKVTIVVGTAIVWTNKDDDPHTVTADDGSFDSKGLGQGDTFRHVFAKTGTYPYHCSAHPFMKGVVVVVNK